MLALRGEFYPQKEPNYGIVSLVLFSLFFTVDRVISQLITTNVKY